VAELAPVGLQHLGLELLAEGAVRPDPVLKPDVGHLLTALQPHVPVFSMHSSEDLDLDSKRNKGILS